MRSRTAFPGTGRDPAARSRILSPSSVVKPPCLVLRASCREGATGRNGEAPMGTLPGHSPRGRSPRHEVRSTSSCTQPQDLLVRPERLEHEGDVLVERGAEFGDPLLDVLPAHPFGESLVLELLL